MQWGTRSCGCWSEGTGDEGLEFKTAGLRGSRRRIVAHRALVMASELGSKPILELANHLLLPPDEVLPGSYGHPELCRRPCVHMHRFGSCLAGANCAYCHEQHHRAPWKLSKHRRSMLQKMPRATLMDLLLHHIYGRVVKHQLLSEAKELLQYLENERCAEPQHTHLNINCNDSPRLSRELSRLSLLALAPRSSHTTCKLWSRERGAQITTIPARMKTYRTSFDGCASSRL